MGVAKDWVEQNFPSNEGSIKAMLILAYGAGMDAGLAEAQAMIEHEMAKWRLPKAAQAVRDSDKARTIPKQ